MPAEDIPALTPGPIRRDLEDKRFSESPREDGLPEWVQRHDKAVIKGDEEQGIWSWA